MSLSFNDMWDLIQANNPSAVFSCELLVGIFWEETMFTNRRQLHGPAVGFGQVEPATMKAVNDYYGTNYSETLILIDDPTSVAITADVLSMFNDKGLSPWGALNAYAGVKARPANQKKVQQWLACEQILKTGGTDDSDNVRAALMAAEPNHGAAVDSVL
jgi:hypothetical protein